MGGIFIFSRRGESGKCYGVVEKDKKKSVTPLLHVPGGGSSSSCHFGTEIRPASVDSIEGSPLIK